jgi:hypothetical protein
MESHCWFNPTAGSTFGGPLHIPDGSFPECECGVPELGTEPSEHPGQGVNLSSVTGVTFGSTAAQHFGFFSFLGFECSWADTPPGTGTVDVTVTTAGGTSATSSADRSVPDDLGPQLTSSPCCGRRETHPGDFDLAFLTPVCGSKYVGNREE